MQVSFKNEFRLSSKQYSHKKAQPHKRSGRMIGDDMSVNARAALVCRRSTTGGKGYGRPRRGSGEVGSKVKINVRHTTVSGKQEGSPQGLPDWPAGLTTSAERPPILRPIIGKIDSIHHFL